MMKAAKFSYGDNFNEADAQEWLNASIKRSDTIFIRGKSSAGMISWHRPIWDKTKLIADIGFVCRVKPTIIEPYFLIEKLVRIAENMAPVTIRLGAETDTDYTPFAKRLGFTKAAPSFFRRVSCP